MMVLVISMDYLIHIHSRAWKTSTQKINKGSNTHQEENQCGADKNPSNDS